MCHTNSCCEVGLVMLFLVFRLLFFAYLFFGRVMCWCDMRTVVKFDV